MAMSLKVLVMLRQMLKTLEIVLYSNPALGCIHTCHVWSASNGPEFVCHLGPDHLCRDEYTQVTLVPTAGNIRLFGPNKQGIMRKVSHSVLLTLLLHGCYKHRARQTDLEQRGDTMRL
ncbi:hypothetical protein XENOCAPTIV_001451 [Xenoophorus captivus]|uniref:Secreted protein n=1 Tax=Xenoophorus captivus TaxID=1517983 RepID=A0ABV0Q4Q7_9TELE